MIISGTFLFFIIFVIDNVPRLCNGAGVVPFLRSILSIFATYRMDINTHVEPSRPKLLRF